MARILTEGFEMGDRLGWSDGGDFNAEFEINANGKRSGNYGARLCLSYVVDIVRYASKSFLSSSEIYFRTGFRISSGGFSTSVQAGIRFKKGLTTLAELRYENSNDRFALYIGGTNVATGVSLIKDVWYLVEVHYKIDDATGIFETKINGIEDISYFGDTKPDANTEMNNVEYYANGEDGYTISWDDIAINDTSGTEDNSWCGDGHIIAIKPNAAGDSSQLTGSDGDSVDNYLLVDDIPANGDTDYVWGNMVDEQDLYNLTAPSLPVNHKITRIWPEIRAKDPDTGDIALPIKAGTTIDDGTTKSLTTDYSAIKGDEYVTNPDTGLAWTEEDLNALQAGVKIKS